MFTFFCFQCVFQTLARVKDSRLDRAFGNFKNCRDLWDRQSIHCEHDQRHPEFIRQPINVLAKIHYRFAVEQTGGMRDFRPGSEKVPGNPGDLIDEALSYLFRNPLSYESKKSIKIQILLSNQLYDYYWTNAWMAYQASPTTANFNVVNTRLKQLFQYFFNLSEYQLA